MSARIAKKAAEATTLLASAARTADGNSQSSPVPLPLARAYAFVLDVTASATDAADTLDVYIQTKLDGTNWVDVVHFTQVAGNVGAAKRFIAKIAAGLATAEFENGTALGAAAVRNLIGDAWCVRWAIADSGDANSSHTFSVTAIPM